MTDDLNRRELMATTAGAADEHDDPVDGFDLDPDYDPDAELPQAPDLDFQWHYSIDEVAELIGVSTRAVSAWIGRAADQLVSIRLDGRLVVDHFDLMEFCEAHERHAVALLADALAIAAHAAGRAGRLPRSPYAPEDLALMAGIGPMVVTGWVAEGMPTRADGRLDHDAVVGFLWDRSPWRRELVRLRTIASDYAR